MHAPSDAVERREVARTVSLDGVPEPKLIVIVASGVVLDLNDVYCSVEAMSIAQDCHSAARDRPHRDV